MNWCTIFFEQIESSNSEHGYLEKQLDSLEAASQPKADEIKRLKELKKIISSEEKEIDKLTQGSKKLKEKVGMFDCWNKDVEICKKFSFINLFP